MEEKFMQLEYSSALIDLVEKNDSFDAASLRIAYTGKNRNRSFISKEAFERAIPSMFGCPVVANYLRDEDEIGSHDGEFVETKDGDINYVNITQPVGFVPPGAQWKWEIVEDNNQIHQYLVTEVLLWKRQEAYKKIKENGITKQSMEISVTEGQMLDDYYDIQNFKFTAFCLLGTAEPCFESAALFTFAHKEEMQEELSKMYEEFKLAFAADEKFHAKEGDTKNMDKLHELLEQYNVSEEDLTFEVEGLTDEELEAAFADAFEVTPEEPEIPEESEFDVDEEIDTPADNFELSGQIRESLGRAVSAAEMIETEWGSYPRYYMVDFDEAAGEVYFQDTTEWNLYGSTYTFNGDNVVVDFENMKRKKYSIVDFDEGEETFSLKECARTVLEAFAKKTGDAYAALESKYNAIVKAENERLAGELFAGFDAKLGGDPEFEAMKKSADLFNLEELEEKLYALVGRKQFKLNKTESSQRAPKAPIIPEEKTSKGPYGDLFNFIEK